MLDDVQLDSGRIFLIVNGEEGYASFVFRNDGVGRDNAGTAGLASPLGRYGHTNLADAWTKFCTLEGVFLKTITEVSDVIRQTTTKKVVEFGLTRTIVCAITNNRLRLRKR